MSGDLAEAIVELRREDALAVASHRLECGEGAAVLIEECRRGMTTVGERFQTGDYFLSELILAAEIFKKISSLLDPHLAASARSAQKAGTIVIATMRGDIHDLGKNIFATLLKAHGFEVRDLGVNVEPRALIETVREVRPEFVGLSALITTAFASMKEAADLLVKAGLRSDLGLLIGGGITTPELRDHVGADFQTIDAAAGVRYCLEHANPRGRDDHC